MDWYNKSKSALEKPYNVFLDSGDSQKYLGVIDIAVPAEDADITDPEIIKSKEKAESNKAMIIARKKYFDLISDYMRNDFLSCVLKAEVDREEWSERQKANIEKNKAETSRQKYKKQREQNTWWND